MSSQQPIAIFAVLGFLNEYVGRYIGRDADLIETFSPSEMDKAPIFEEYLLQLIEENELDTTTRREIFGDRIEQGVHFRSKELTHLIDSYYLNHLLTGSEADGSSAYTEGEGFFRKSPGLISEAVFPPGDREARLSYLTGAYQRYGEQNFFRLANAAHKVQLIAKLLKEAGCPNVVIIDPHQDAVPWVFLIAFEPTQELVDRFELDWRWWDEQE